MSGEEKRIWVVKARSEPRNGAGGWDWDEYLFVARPYADKLFNWGGEAWIHGAASKKHIRDEVHVGDLVVCYRVDDREIVGLTTMASDGYEETAGSGDFNRFGLASSNDAFPLTFPLPIKDLYANDCHPKCFGMGTQGTIFPVEPDEFACIVETVIKMRVAPRRVFELWLQWAGWKR